MNNNKVPQYYNDFMWKDFDYLTEENNFPLVSTLESMEKYINYSLYYPFYACGENQHAHDFYMVIKFVYDFPKSFYLNDNDKKWYSQSQLEFIKRLVDKCIKDGLNDIRIKEENKFIYNVEEMQKRNYNVDDIEDK